MITNIEKLREFAQTKHREAGKKYGDLDYVYHLDMVHRFVSMFLKMSRISPKDSEHVRRAAYGHDLIEDVGMTYNDVSKVFGKEEADIIFGVTDETGKNRKERLFRTLPKIGLDIRFKILKMADRYANGWNSRENGHRMYEVYRQEYPIFRYYLKSHNSLVTLWDMLDDLYKFEER